MIYEREDLIYNTVARIQQNGGELTYFDIGKAVRCEANISPWGQALVFLEMSVICHNIPFYKNGQRFTRELNECFMDSITFYNANKDECEIVLKSSDRSKIYTDILSGFTLSRLTLGDDTHRTFKSGSGKAGADLKDANGVSYEVKRNYREGSRSGLHGADFIIDCLNTTIEIRKVEADGSIDFDHYPIARFNGFLSDKVIAPKTCMEEELLQLIYSGELITEIEKRLQEAGFTWNP